MFLIFIVSVTITFSLEKSNLNEYYVLGLATYTVEQTANDFFYISQTYLNQFLVYGICYNFFTRVEYYNHISSKDHLLYTGRPT